MSLEEPRTLLEQLVAQGQHTWPEVHAQFDKHARVMAVESGERAATVGWRQLQRIAAGEVTKPHPSTVRVLQRQFNRKIHELLGPPNRAESRPEERDVLSVINLGGHQFGSLEVAYVPSKIGHETEVDARESQFDRIAPRRPDSSVVDESVMHTFRTDGKSIRVKNGLHQQTVRPWACATISHLTHKQVVVEYNRIPGSSLNFILNRSR